MQIRFDRPTLAAIGLLALYFAVGIPVEGQTQLNGTDAYLFTWLANTEAMRRRNSPEEFSQFLQERRESNEPFLRETDNPEIKDLGTRIDGWINTFQSNR